MRLRFLVVLLAVFSVLEAYGQKAPQYMHLFYYGPQNSVGPVLRFSPAFRNQKEINLSKPDTYTKNLQSFVLGPGEDTIVSTSSYTTNQDGTMVVDGKKLTSEQAKAWHKEQQAKQKAQQDVMLSQLSEHVDNTTSLLTTWLNNASADGWEVAQMTSLPNGGLVYLLRKQ